MKRSTKWLSLALALVFALALLPGAAFAEGAESPVLTGAFGGGWSWEDYDTGRLVIDGAGEMPTAPAAWEDFSEKVSSVSFYQGVTSISEGAFSTFYCLNWLYLPHTVTRIGENAFSACWDLLDLYFTGGSKAEWESVSVAEGNGPLGIAKLHCTNFTTSLPTLDKPYDLQWGGEYLDMEDYEGFMRWTSATPEGVQKRCWVLIWDNDTGKLVYHGRKSPGYGGSSYYWDEFFRNNSILESGDYVFTVRALGDGVHALSSAMVASAVWHYEAPEAQLTAPTGLGWEIADDGETVAVWNYAEGEEPAGVSIRFYYSPTEDGELEYVTGYTSGVAGLWGEGLKGDYGTYYEVKSTGDGWYAFDVRTISGDIDEIRNSEWSAMSEPVYIAREQPGLLDAITDGLSSGSKPEELLAAIDAVRAIDKDTLYQAMLANQDGKGDGVIFDLSCLDSYSLGFAFPDISDAIWPLLGNSGYECIGLACSAEPGAAITYRLTPAYRPHAVPAGYGKAVQFSTGIVDRYYESLTVPGEELAVPLWFRFPLPAGIDPEKAAVLFWDGAAWQELPAPYMELLSEGTEYESQTFAFVARCVGDFAVVEKSAAARDPWDLDGSGEIGAADAGALFGLLSGGPVPAGVTPPDVNEDRKLNNKDAILLFRKGAGIA